jgi:hypothetical protein
LPHHEHEFSFQTRYAVRLNNQLDYADNILMSTITQVEKLADAGGNESLPVQSSGLFATHWRGNYSLAKSYWRNGVLLFGLGINLPLLILIVVALNIFQKQPALLLVVCLGEMALILAAYVWVLVGTWRAARKYKGPGIWAILAQIGMVMGVIVTIAHISQDVTVISHVASGHVAAENVTVGR